MDLYLQKVYRAALIAAALLMVSLSLQAQTKTPRHTPWNWKQHRSETIGFAKKYIVSGIEPGLPGRSFSKWFRALLGNEAKLNWTIVDCAYEAGDGGTRDHTMCVMAEALLGSDFAVMVYLQVGTFRGGISPGKPILRYARVSREDEPAELVYSLTDLPRSIDRMMSK